MISCTAEKEQMPKKTPKMFSETFPLTQRDSDKTMQIWTGAHLVSFLSSFFFNVKALFFSLSGKNRDMQTFDFNKPTETGEWKKNGNEKM